MKKIPTIGVLAGIQVYYGTILGNFIGPLLHGVHSAAEKRGCNLLLACGMDSTSYTDVHPAWSTVSPDVDFVPVGPWNTDGLIVVSPLFSETKSQYIQGLIAAGHPIVFVATGEAGPTVAIDNAGAVRQALLHLMEHGHRQIAFIAGYPDDLMGDSGIRLKAFREITRQYGLEPDPKLIAWGSHGINGGEQAMRQILDAHVPFTAVLASNDESAIGAMRTLKEAGYRIPEDIAIIGNDDSFEAVTQNPPLTTFHSSPFSMGYEALQLILDAIEGRTRTLESITIPTQFVIRESCGCRPRALSKIRIEDEGEEAPRGMPGIGADQMARMMTDAILAGTQRLSPDEVHSRCQQLAEAFVEGLASNNPARFHQVFEETLARVESLGDDLHVWDTTLSILESSVGSIRGLSERPATNPPLLSPVAEARARIMQYLQRQHRRLVANRTWIADQIGQLNARLLTALDEAQVYEILADSLPQIGLQDIGVAFFEAEADDPAAWCRLRRVSRHQIESRFLSRQFPPEALYGAPYHLALLPMVGHQETPGFVAFDAADLEICAPIVWQLVTFLKVVGLYREATHGRQVAEEANRLKSRFLSTVSHELRTPLNLIVGLSEMLLQESDQVGEAAGQDVRRIHTNAQHLDGLIRDVLDLAQNEVGELRLICSPLDLADVFKLVAAAGEQLAHDKNLEWRVSIPDDLPRVWGDRTRLRQVLLNLINNAVKFTTRGHVALTVRADAGTVTVEISDSGLGIQPDEQTVIFDEFRQSERTTARGYGGLGLGLAICKRLIEMHGGRIGVQSSGEEEAGSTFFFTLPAMAGAAEPGPADTVNQQATAYLLAEHTAEGERLRDYLARQGFNVEMIWIQAGGIWPPYRIETRPDAIIVEQGTTPEQGWAVVKALRENPLTADIPVLFYSLDTGQDSGSVLELNYLTKPLNKPELIQSLERWRLRDTHQAQIILIVDDDPSTLELHARMIAGWSPECRIMKAGNGREALKLIHAESPDLILLDLIMPELDGFGVLEAMRGDPRTRDIPVIVLTGQTLTLEDMTALGRGVSSVLKKGLFSTSETLSRIDAALTRSSSLGSEAQRVVRKVVAYLHTHYMEQISLEDAARYVSMSKEYLARCFRQETGITLVTYLNRYRIEQARVLLEKGERSLTEIALETGFSSSAYFSRVFRQEVGYSPSEYVRPVK